MAFSDRVSEGESKAGGMSEQRRKRLRMEISREAARLFWAKGVAATSGEEIAQAVGISVRTLWRHFRSKESCAEPIVAAYGEWYLAALRGWPRGQSIEEYFAEVRDNVHRTPEQIIDDVAGAQLVALGDDEPALRSAWLMASDQIERELAAVIADRLGRPVDDIEVRMHAAAAWGAVRVINEALGRQVVEELERDGHVTLRSDPFEDMARAVRTATGGAIGDAVES
jgi:AcrR family transcriptional regulator